MTGEIKKSHNYRYKEKLNYIWHLIFLKHNMTPPMISNSEFSYEVMHMSQKSHNAIHIISNKKFSGYILSNLFSTTWPLLLHTTQDLISFSVLFHYLFEYQDVFHMTFHFSLLFTSGELKYFQSTNDSLKFRNICYSVWSPLWSFTNSFCEGKYKANFF